MRDHRWELPRGQRQVLRHLYELVGLAKSWVIPLPKDRALRFGFKLDWWVGIGPRRYQVVATPEFVEQYEKICGVEDGELRLADMGVRVQREKGGSA